MTEPTAPPAGPVAPSWRASWRSRLGRWLVGDAPSRAVADGGTVALADADPRLEPAVELRQAYALAIALTLVILLTGAPPRSPALLPLVALAGLAVPRIARHRWYWLLVFGLFVLSPIARPWLALDNHHWLQLYWVGAITLSRFALRGEAALRLSARLLVGLAFVFAVVWKLLAPEFASGGFFEFRIASDRRLADVFSALGLLDEGAPAANRRVITGWRDPLRAPAPGPVTVSEVVVRISPWLAWATIVVEASVAVTFLAPLARRWRWLRDTALLVFVAGTYPFAPVLGFGHLLLAMGAMHSELTPRRRAVVYVVGFLAVSLMSERDVALDWLRGLTN